MPTLTIPNVFSAGTDAIAAEVNANFDAIKTLLNTTKLDGANIQDDSITHAKLGSVPTVRVRRTTDLAVTTNTTTNVTWQAEDWDTDTMFTASSTDITIKTAGKYRVWAFASWAADTNLCSVSIVKNGTTALARSSVPSINSDIQNFLSAYGEAQLAVNDVITVSVFQDRGATRNLLSESAAGVTWMGD